MKTLKYLSFVGKVAGLVPAFNVIPLVEPQVVGVIVFATASILMGAVNRIGDLFDDVNFPVFDHEGHEFPRIEKRLRRRGFPLGPIREIRGLGHLPSTWKRRREPLEHGGNRKVADIAIML